MTTAGERGTARTLPPARLAAVRQVTDDRAYLYRLIQTIGAGPDIDLILRGVVGLVAEATACHACFVYFRRDAHLELRAASPMYEHLEGEIRIPLGEGLTGWVAKTRRSAHIRERALDDPRVRRAQFSELGDEVYQSLVSVPILGRSGDVVGVITLHAEAPYEFGRADLDFLEHTASLIGGAVENARLYEEATARVELLSELSQLSRRIASAASEPELLRIVAEGVGDLLGTSEVQLLLFDADGELRPAAAAPGRTRAHALDLGAVRVGAIDDSRRDREEVPAHRAVSLWGARPEGIPLVVPLDVGEERLGVLGVLLPAPRPDASAALSSVAAHAAVALKQHQVIERLREKNVVKDFFQLLARSDTSAEQLSSLASTLGCDLRAPHLVLHVAPWNRTRSPSGRRRTRPEATTRPWPDLAGQLEGRLAARFPGLLVDNQERSLRGLLPLGALAPADALGTLRQMDWGDPVEGSAVSVGVSDPCDRARSFTRGFDEALSAAEVGGLIRGTPGVTSYEELGPYRYVLRSEDDLRDRSQHLLDRLVEYDGRRGTRLLDTLESYLDHRGNVVATARVLFIHPNTLRQRLDRIERLTGIDLERSDWLSLAVATKVVKLRRMRDAAGREGGNDG